jgi:short-subunit dehydrogenase
VRGYSEALRIELQDSNVHVCCVHPGGIKTNIARDSRGGEGSPEDKDMKFQQMAITSPESAAAQIIKAMEKRKKRLLLGLDAKLVTFASWLAPVSYPKLLGLFIKVDF